MLPEPQEVPGTWQDPELRTAGRHTGKEAHKLPYPRCCASGFFQRDLHMHSDLPSLRWAGKVRLVTLCSEGKT